MVAQMRRESKSVDDFLSETTIPKVKYLTIIKKVWIELFVIFFTFFITFMLYPSILYQKK